MFTVRTAMNREGFTISIGDYHPTFAKTISEVTEALFHYYGRHERKCNSEICPFCKQLEEQFYGNYKKDSIL